ncbi:biotin-dependent carboxyltransferase family protein [Desulfacinum hydrothermale]|uniref:5-oxoprolinase subunit C family protein n=1 Tax=Desulfacinum hydrothermale TaxID=109258 RepID=UPI001BB052BD|nr:biotin-dependent carboxyltransferase family protein [Desulfacinum hydrothermale]
MRIDDPGPLTTVQDAGRFGYQDRGVPVCGAMDPAALILGNLLVGNKPGEAALEILFGGFRATFLNSTVFAVTGADPEVRHNGERVAPWVSLTAAPGDTVAVDAGDFGARHYLCVKGGVDVPLVLGSKSTYVRGGFGGHEGRAFRKGDMVATGVPVDTALDCIPRRLRPAYDPSPMVRVVLGPQAERITEQGLQYLLSSPYTVTQRADRMGIMLDGPKLTHTRGADILSDGIALGSIQVPGEGLPFILMADRATTGGYVKAATVVTRDIPLVAQLLPGAVLHFCAVTIEEAREAHLKWAFLVKRFVERQRAQKKTE